MPWSSAINVSRLIEPQSKTHSPEQLMGESLLKFSRFVDTKPDNE